MFLAKNASRTLYMAPLGKFILSKFPSELPDEFSSEFLSEFPSEFACEFQNNYALLQ